MVFWFASTDVQDSLVVGINSLPWVLALRLMSSPIHSANRIYVHQDVLGKFTSLLLGCGSGLDLTVTHGPPVNRAAVHKLHRHIEDALAMGAKLVYGGKLLNFKGMASSMSSQSSQIAPKT